MTVSGEILLIDQNNRTYSIRRILSKAQIKEHSASGKKLKSKNHKAYGKNSSNQRIIHAM